MANSLSSTFDSSSSTDRDGRFRKLEILLLDDNCFSNVDVFAALAGLRKYELVYIVLPKCLLKLMFLHKLSMLRRFFGIVANIVNI